MPDEIELVDLDVPERKLPVVVDIKVGQDQNIALRFSASHEATNRGSGMGFETWIWVAGRPTVLREGGKVDEVTDVMNGTTRLRVEDSCPEAITMLMVESWLINHERSWALASTEAERDLNDRRLSEDGQSVEQIEA